MIGELQDKEYYEFVDGVAKIINHTIGSVVTLSDILNVDRDSAMQYFADALNAMCYVSTFKNWGKHGKA